MAFDVQLYERKAARHGYIMRVLVALDIFFNVIFGGREDETISSRVRRISDANPAVGYNPLVWLAKIINGGLNIIQPNHGMKAQAGDLERATAVTQVENKALDQK